MLILFETPAGLALFKLNDKKAFDSVDSVEALFKTPETASKGYPIDFFSHLDFLSNNSNVLKTRKKDSNLLEQSLKERSQNH
jgi:hypothetical protein